MYVHIECPPGGRRNRRCRRGRTLAARTDHHSWFLFRYNFSVSAASSAFRLPRRRCCRRHHLAAADEAADRVGRRRWHGDVQVAGPVAGRSQVYTYSSFCNIIIIIILPCTWRR